MRSYNDLPESLPGLTEADRIASELCNSVALGRYIDLQRDVSRNMNNAIACWAEQCRCTPEEWLKRYRVKFAVEPHTEDSGSHSVVVNYTLSAEEIRPVPATDQ